MGTEYVVLHTVADRAKVLQDNEEKGLLRKTGENKVFEFLAKEGGQNLRLTNEVDGALRPFSIVCFSSDAEVRLKIKDHIFLHSERFYSVGLAAPVDASQKDLITGSKFICRLVNFPFSQVEGIDEETKHQMKRHRGIAVGSINGLGADGYHVKLYGEELQDVGLPLTTATYILYTTR